MAAKSKDGAAPAGRDPQAEIMNAAREAQAHSDLRTLVEAHKLKNHHKIKDKGQRQHYKDRFTNAMQQHQNMMDSLQGIKQTPADEEGPVPTASPGGGGVGLSANGGAY